MRWLPLAILALLLPPSSPAAARALWRFRSFTSRDGLAHNVVRDVLEDRHGTIWFATMGGLTRYQPRRCRVERVDLQSPQRLEVMRLAEGHDGSLWVATQGGGVGRLRKGRWTWFGRRHGLPSEEITSLLVDRAGNLWATPTGGGLTRYDGKGWRTFTHRDGLSSGEIGRCASLQSGALLCGTYERPLLQRYQDGRWTQQLVEVPSRKHFYVHAVLERRNGELWLATKGAGVIQGQPIGRGRYRWTLHDTAAGLAGSRVGALLEARDGSLWAATSAGASRWDGQRWRSLTRRDGLGSNQIFAITETRDGALWFASLGGGASRYAPSRWEQLGEAEGLPSESVSGGLALMADGSLWAGTDQGLAMTRDLAGPWTAFRTEQPGLDHVNHLLPARDGGLWIATRQGLRRWRAGRFEEVEAAPEVVVKRLAEDSRGRLWLGTETGVVVREGTRWTAFGSAQGLPSPLVNDLLVDPGGRIWAATDSGVAQFDGHRWSVSLSGAAHSRVSRIHRLALDDRGVLWASGLEGVAALRPGGWQMLASSPWLPAGLYSRFVTATPDGSLWFAVRGLGVRRLRHQIWTAFSSRHGLAADTVVDVKQARDGSLLFATLGGGISRYRPEHDPPQTWLGVGGKRPAGGLPTRIVKGEAAVIHFSASDVLKETETSDLLFSWRLDGGRWSPFASSSSAILQKLAAGPHLFEVRAMDQDMNIDSTPVRHQFQVVRPWWAEPWLLTLLATALGLGLFSGLRSVRAMARERAAVTRERKAVAQEQATLVQRRGFVRLASHELRKPLARLAHRAEMLSEAKVLDDPSRRREYATAIAEDSRRLAKLVETLLDQARVQDGLRQQGGGALELRHGDLRELVASVLNELAAEPGATAVTVRTGAEPLPVKYDAFLLPLAVRNLLENALKYAAQAGPIEVVGEASQGWVRLLVRDQGPGIPEGEREQIFEPFFRGRGRGAAEVSGFGLGLAFARDIARAHGGDLTLEAPARGACFCLRLPLHTE